MITNRESDTSIHEIDDGLYRISTPIRFPNGPGFTFNQFLVAAAPDFRAACARAAILPLWKL